MAQTLSQKLLPTSYEIWCVALVSAGVLIAGNSQMFLDRVGLLDSSAVVHEGFTGAVQNGLLVLDNFSITPNLVTFLVWSGAGLIAFSILQAFARASGIIEFERDIGSNRYIHPSNFSRSRYWGRIVSDTFLSSLAFLTLGIYGFFYIAFLLPVMLTYTRPFMDNITVSSFAQLLLGVLGIFVATFLLYMSIEIIVWRHRISLN